MVDGSQCNVIRVNKIIYRHEACVTIVEVWGKRPK